MSKQLLHLVFGGHVDDPGKLEFSNVEELDIVGIYPNFAAAKEAWQRAAQASVDDANKRYVVVHLHRLLDPDEDPES